MDMRDLINLSEAPLRREDMGWGMEVMYADEAGIALSGGWRSGNSSAGFTRCAYEVIDIALFKETGDQKSSSLGLVELFIGKGGQIDGLVNIKLNPKNRKAGTGSKIVSALLETCPHDLVICDIQTPALGFWKKVGAEFFNRNGIPLDVKDKTKLKSVVVYGVVRKPGSTTQGVEGLPFFTANRVP